MVSLYYALTKIGAWGLREANLTLLSMDSTLNLLEKRVKEFIHEIVPEDTIDNKTYVVSHAVPNFHDNSKILKKYIDNIVNDISE